MRNDFYVYILANKKNGTLYIGITNDLIRRISEHKSKSIDGFTKKYDINKLVYYEWSNCINGAILREKQLKTWKRDWKVNLIEKDNKEWKDLYYGLFK